MGADDLVDFIGGYFVELGITIVERAYLGEVLNFVFDYMTENVPKWLKGIGKLFSNAKSEQEALEEEIARKQALGLIEVEEEEEDEEALAKKLEQEEKEYEEKKQLEEAKKKGILK